MKIYLIYYLFLISTLLIADNQKKYIYKTKFKSLNVGTTEINIQDHIEDTEKLIFTIESFSNKWIDLIYKLRHHSSLIVNRQDYALLNLSQKVQQADYLDSYNAIVDYDKSVVYYENLKNLNNEPKQESYIVPIEGKVYDPFAIIFYLKNIPLNLNQNYLFNYYSKKNIKTLKLDVIKKEFVKTPHSNQQCFLVVPYATNNEYLLKNKGEMKIWYTADSLQIPIKIQQKMRHGVMELLLLDYYEK